MGEHRLQSAGSVAVAQGLSLKSRNINLPTKVCLVKAMVFPVVMYGCESCTVKKAELLEKTPESPLDYKIKLVNPKGNQP